MMPEESGVQSEPPHVTVYEGCTTSSTDQHT